LFGISLAKRLLLVIIFSISVFIVGRGRNGVENALRQISAKAMVIGIESDILFPLAEQQYLAQHIPAAAYTTIRSTYGHDGFLLELEQITHCINSFLPVKKIIEPMLADGSRA